MLRSTALVSRTSASAVWLSGGYRSQSQPRSFSLSIMATASYSCLSNGRNINNTTDNSIASVALQQRRRNFSTARVMNAAAEAESTESSSAVQKTALYDFHVKHGGKMVDFGGWYLPMQYSNLRSNESHAHTRTAASIFDVSHMLQLKLTGTDRVKFLEKLVVADVTGLPENSATLSLFTNEQGGIIDDAVITNAGDHLYIVCNAACAEKDLKHINTHLSAFKSKGEGNADIQVLRCRSLLALQGPKSMAVLSSVLNVDLTDLKFMSRVRITDPQFGECWITRCGYTGEDGFEVSVKNENCVKLCEKLLSSKDVEMAGLGPRDSLRQEAGLCLYGNDINETTTPVDAVLTWTIGKARRTDDASFLGSKVILEQLKAKSGKLRRAGLLVDGPSPARHGAKIFTADGETEIGEITSGIVSPTLKQSIAAAYIEKPHNKKGTEVMIEIRKKKVKAKVVKMPFVETKYYK